MPTDSATWRSIREDFEGLPPAGVEDFGAEWSLIWTSRPPVAMFLPIQLPSQWTWFHPTDAGLRTRASAIFLKAAKARGYDTEDQWLDELRYADFVRFQLSGSGRDRLPDGTVVEHESGVLKDAVKHSITLCHQLEAGSAPKPIIGRLPSEAIARLEAATAAFMAEYLPKLEREVPKLEHEPDRRIREVELLRELVIHHFETAARECMTQCASVAEFEADLRADIARFVQFRVGQYQWLGDAMRSELFAGFTFFIMRANPWAGIPETDRASKWYVGAIIGEALSHTALKLIAEATARAAAGGFPEPDQAGSAVPIEEESACTNAGLAVNGANPAESDGKGRKRGPKSDHEAASRVAEIVARVAPDGDWRLKLDNICEALDEAQIPFPTRWRKRDRSCDGWAAYDERANAVKAIEYRLEIARQRKKATPETLS